MTAERKFFSLRSAGTLTWAGLPARNLRPEVSLSVKCHRNGFLSLKCTGAGVKHGQQRRLRELSGPWQANWNDGALHASGHAGVVVFRSVAIAGPPFRRVSSLSEFRSRQSKDSNDLFSESTNIPPVRVCTDRPKAIKALIMLPGRSPSTFRRKGLPAQ